MSNAIGNPAYREEWQSDGTLDVVRNSDDATLVDDVSLTIGGIAAGYKVARGTVAGTATPSVATGLTTITGYAVSAVAITATAANVAAAVTAKPQASTPGTLAIFRWKITAPSTATLVAATAAGTVSWVAVGT